MKTSKGQSANAKNHEPSDPREIAWNRELGAIIRAERKRRALSVTQAAGLIGIAERTLFSYEKGDRRPDARMLLRLVAVMQLDLDKLVKHALRWEARLGQRRASDKRQLSLFEQDDKGE